MSFPVPRGITGRIVGLLQLFDPVPLLQFPGKAVLETSMTEKKKEFLGGDDALSRAAGGPPASSRRFRAITTRDHDVIRQWAQRHKAEPATGEESPSGPAVVRVNDGGAGVRFNFPGAAPYRPIDWEEWFDNFDRHECAFVFDNDADGKASSSRYRIVNAWEWKDFLK